MSLSPLELIQGRISRRQLLLASGKLLTGAVLLSNGFLTACSPRLELSPEFQARALSPDDFKLAYALQNHLIPSAPNSPGAKEAKATDYLNLVLTSSATDPKEKSELTAGFELLRRMSKNKYNDDFHQLPEPAREAILRSLEAEEAGAEWLTLVMSYTLEAYLGDPAYTGQTYSGAWAYLGHSPGFPRPSPDEIL